MLFSLLFMFNSAFAQSQPASTSGKTIALALEELMSSPEYQSTVSEIRSIELDYASRDLVLEPELEVGAERINENRQLLNPGAVTTKPRIDLLSATLSKPFATGTTISFGPSWERALTPNLTPGNRDTMDWQIGLSQSLWKDGFGRSTRLRRAREESERKQQLALAYLRRGQLLYDFESLYWDWALALREQELQVKNLKRSREILRWVNDRFRRSAAESTDLLQARALTAQRELRVAAVRQTLTLAGSRIERYVPNRKWQPQPSDLSVARPLDSLLPKWEPDALPKILPLETVAATAEASAAGKRAQEARETIRPELNLELAYGKNAIDTEGGEALRRSYKEDHEYSSVGVVFRTGLDLANERRFVDSFRAAHDAAAFRGAAREAEGRVAWEELKRELADLQERIKTAQELVDLQWRTANAERQRYRTGRSTAFQAITFEQDAAESELTLWTLYALMRKTEARARLFAR